MTKKNQVFRLEVGMAYFLNTRFEFEGKLQIFRDQKLKHVLTFDFFFETLS